MRITPHQKAVFMATIIDNPYIPHEPTKKQTMALLSPQKEILFGGAAGGGKSDLLLMAALQYVHISDYGALILRRTFKQLSKADGLIPRAHEWLQGTPARWQETEKKWTFPSGATFEFGHLEHENSKYDYQGPAFHYIGFDELTQFSLSQFTYVQGRTRRKKGSPIPIRIRASSNPGGVGHEWVKRRYITSFSPRRLFIPSRLEDNPYLDQEEYREALMELDPITRRQLLYGDWDVRLTGGMFDRTRAEVIPVAPPDLERVVRYWDMAATKPKPGRDPDWTVGLLMGVKDGIFYILDVIRVQQEPATLEHTLRNAAMMDGTQVMVRGEEEGGASGKIVTNHYARRVFQGFDYKGIRSTGNKADRARPVSAAWDNGLVKLVAGPWVDDFLYEVEAFPQPDGGVHDDQVDGMSGAFTALQSGRLAYGML